jgi:C-terminal processing protease CtpA/Prc
MTKTPRTKYVGILPLMVRRVIVLLAVVCCICTGQTSYERLAAAARLWAYVKYCDPGATAAGVDWDAALADATPKILDAKNEQEFAAAVNGILAALKDPMTHVTARMEGDFTRLKPVVTSENGVTVVRLETGGNIYDAIQKKNAFATQLQGKRIVLFDIRGSQVGQYVLPDSLPMAKESIGPSLMMRVHSGYANDSGTGRPVIEGGAKPTAAYRSYWEAYDLLSPSSSGIGTGDARAIFLVNHETTIPELALAMQDSGAGAIVSEDAIDDRQIRGANGDYFYPSLSRQFTILGRLDATVRTAVLLYRDGTTGFVANTVLHQTGEAALKVALEIAKSGNWPAPERPKLNLPPAGFIEKTYTDQPFPSAEYRMLAAARIWGVFHYFHPYRHLYGEDWDAVLKDFLPKMARSGNARDYHLAVAEMVTHVHDAHCVPTSDELSGFYGAAGPPIELRWIESQPVVTRVFDPKADIRPGDVITKIDGESYENRSGELMQHISASTTQSLMARTMVWLLRGPRDSIVRLTVRRGAEPDRDVLLTRREERYRVLPLRAGDAFRLLNPKIGYVDLEKLTNGQVDEMFDLFKDTNAIILDMRAYPQGTGANVAARLIEHPGAVFAQFRRNLVRPDIGGDGTGMSLTWEMRVPATTKPRYKGKTIMLIDERAISQSENAGMQFRVANGTKFIGSPTMGADGDISFFMAPGGIRINFSGHDMRWPDGSQVQRIGLLPDIAVQPTINGIRDGRDEVLERAMTYVENGR